MNLLKISYILTTLNLVISCLQIGESGFLRFLPTISQLVNLCLFVVLYFSGAYPKDKKYGVIIVWMMYVTFQTIFLVQPAESSFVVLLKSCYWCSFYFIIRALVGKVGHVVFDKYLLYTTLIFIIASSYTVLTQQSFLSAAFGQLVGVNAVYYLLLLLPFSVMIENRKKRWVIIVLTFLVTLFSLKRTAIFIMLASLIICLYYDFIKRNKGSSSSRVIILLLIAISFGFLMYVPSSPLANVFDRFSSIEDDNGSGRERIYNDVVMLFQNLPSYSQLFGRGFCMVQEDINGAGNGLALSAHNDFLEVLYDFGIVGLIIYLIFILKLLTRCVFLLKRKSYYAPSYLVSIVILLLTSSFSHLIIYPTYYLFLVAYWAYIEYRLQLERCNLI